MTGADSTASAPARSAGRGEGAGAATVTFVGGACLIATVVASAALKKAGETGTPVLPPGAWRPVLWVGVIASFVAYAAAVAFFARVRVGSYGVAFAIAVLIQAAPLTTSLILAGDAQFYVNDATSPHPYASPSSSPYGPLWTAISRLVVHTSDPVFIFRLIAFGSVLAITGLVSTLSTHKTLAVALVGWNPLVAFHFSGGGHIDAFMTLLVVGALWLVAAGRVEAAGAAWIASIFVKLSAAPVYVLWAIGARRRGLIGTVTSAVALVVLSTWLFGWSWLDEVENAKSVQYQRGGSFLWGWLENFGLSWHTEVVLSSAAWLIAFALFALQASRRRCHLGLATGVLMLLAPHIDAWYLILPLALAAADDDDRFGKLLAVVLSGIMITDILTPLIA